MGSLESNPRHRFGCMRIRNNLPGSGGSRVGKGKDSNKAVISEKSLAWP